MNNDTNMVASDDVNKPVMVTIGADWYEELLQAKIQRDMLLNIVKNTSSYNVKDYIKAVFNLNLEEPED